MSPVLEKSKLIVVGGWVFGTYVLLSINEDGTTKNEEEK